MGKPKKDAENIWAVHTKENPEVISLSALHTNDNNDWEMAYRFRGPYWGKGFGSETTLGLIHFCFLGLGLEKITADVNIENFASFKILEKHMVRVKDFYKEKDFCTNRRYELYKENWKLQ